MFLLDFCAVCNCLAFTDKTKKVSNTILLDICPDFQPQQLIESVLCSTCKTHTTEGLWPLYLRYSICHLSHDIY